MQKHESQVISGSLAASAFVGMVQMLTRTEPLTPVLYAAVLAFAIAIPMLVMVVLLPPSEYSDDTIWEYWMFTVGVVTAWLLAVGGIGLLFWHLDRVFGIAFGASAFVSLFYFAIASPGLREKGSST